MRELAKRLERLEQEAKARDGGVMLLKWMGEPNTAKCGGESITRAAGESAEDFTHRAADRFRPASGWAYVWIGTAAKNQQLTHSQQWA
jgi:hypothetical protein